LLDDQCVTGFVFAQHARRAGVMAGDSEDPEAAADRLEAALERIAQAAARPEIVPAPDRNEEIAARLDGLIDRLRTALGTRPG
jgi:hypothetical protein